MPLKVPLDVKKMDLGAGNAQARDQPAMARG
jgi:hypothetical protein